MLALRCASRALRDAFGAQRRRGRRARPPRRAPGHARRRTPRPPARTPRRRTPRGQDAASARCAPAVHHRCQPWVVVILAGTLRNARSRFSGTLTSPRTRPTGWSPGLALARRRPFLTAE